MPVSSEGTWKKEQALEKRASKEKMAKDQQEKSPDLPAPGPEAIQPQGDRQPQGTPTVDTHQY